MPTLSPNIENRVRKLPKPSNPTQGLQPLFEAVSNAVYAIEDRFASKSKEKGVVTIKISGIGKKSKLVIEVLDNGIGLDKQRFDAFCEVDTDYKQAKGGKGVGRLFWLDAFRSINVLSNYEDGSSTKWIEFKFILRNNEQVEICGNGDIGRDEAEIGTTVIFSGFNSSEYEQHFPTKADSFLKYFSAHFIADFLLGTGPTINVDIDGTKTIFPKTISSLVVGEPLEAINEVDDYFGDLSIVGFTCVDAASTGLDGRHQLHLLANGRTVETRKIDNLLGLEWISRDGKTHLVFHGCLSCKYLDDRVNEGRTAFNIQERTLSKLVRSCVNIVKAKFFNEQIQEYEIERRQKYEEFVSRHPIYGFDSTDTQLSRVPFHAKDPEEFATGLVKYQIRREEDRQNALQDVIDKLDLDTVPTNFGDTVERAAREIHASEQLALAQHVVRRKLVLEVLEKLVKRIRKNEAKADDYHLESTLHSFICPMHVRGDDHSEVKGRAHDLWIVDERLAFTRAFSSDKRLDQILKDNTSGLRPDLLIWDLAYGLGVTDPEKDQDKVDMSEPLRKVMIVEFKRPGRDDYQKVEDQIEQQITKYLAQLKGGRMESFDRNNIKIADDCIFYCYVIADIRGDLELQVSGWPTTANGRGRIRALSNKYSGTIEIIQWQDLINDAWMRNKATLYAAGLSRSLLK
jgi:hypothetical protein